MKRLAVSAVVASLLLSGGLYAKETAKKGASTQEIKQVAVNNAKEDARKKAVKLVQEAIDSLGFAHQALAALDKNDIKTAKASIEKALGKLESILASKKVPELLPIDNVVRVSEFVGTSAHAKEALKEVRKLLDEGKVQEARLALNALQSEIDITVVNLPLGTYPDALKLAAKHLHNGQNEAAKAVLATALSTFVEVTQVVPLPLLKAHDLIVAAESMAKEKKETALKYLESARDQLKVAEVLGYVSDSDVSYKALYETIDKVEKEIKGPNKAEALFKSLKEKLKSFADKVVNPTEKKAAK